MREKNFRNDIIEASINSAELNDIIIIYKKALFLNKIIDQQIGSDIVSSYKRASNILDNEIKVKTLEISNTTDPGIFKNE
jgi:glycyl-tRNA synthetase beta chain